MFYFSMILIAAALCFVVSAKRRNRFSFSDRQSVLIVFIGCVSGFLGAKLLFVIQNPTLPLTLGGLSFFGTVILAPAGLLAAAKLTKRDFGSVLDFAGLYVPFALAFARIGCFVTGCCVAVPVILSDGSTFIPPIQLIEAVLDMICFLMLIARERNGMVRYAGEQYPIFVIMYSFIRMLTEVYRDTPKNCAGMSEGQWFSVCCAVAAATVLFLITKAGLKKQSSEVKNVKKGKN